MADRKAVWLVALVITALVTPAATAATTVYEAEQAVRTSGAVESNHDGYTGTGFVNYDNVIGSSVEFTTPLPEPRRVGVGQHYHSHTADRSRRGGVRLLDEEPHPSAGQCPPQSFSYGRLARSLPLKKMALAM